MARNFAGFCWIWGICRGTGTLHGAFDHFIMHVNCSQLQLTTLGHCLASSFSVAEIGQIECFKYILCSNRWLPQLPTVTHSYKTTGSCYSNHFAFWSVCTKTLPTTQINLLLPTCKAQQIMFPQCALSTSNVKQLPVEESGLCWLRNEVLLQWIFFSTSKKNPLNRLLYLRGLQLKQARAVCYPEFLVMETLLLLSVYVCLSHGVGTPYPHSWAWFMLIPGHTCNWPRKKHKYHFNSGCQRDNISLSLSLCIFWLAEAFLVLNLFGTNSYGLSSMAWALTDQTAWCIQFLTQLSCIAYSFCMSALYVPAIWTSLLREQHSHENITSKNWMSWWFDDVKIGCETLN